MSFVKEKDGSKSFAWYSLVAMTFDLSSFLYLGLLGNACMLGSVEMKI